MVLAQALNVRGKETAGQVDPPSYFLRCPRDTQVHSVSVKQLDSRQVQLDYTSTHPATHSSGPQLLWCTALMPLSKQSARRCTVTGNRYGVTTSGERRTKDPGNLAGTNTRQAATNGGAVGAAGRTKQNN